MVQNGLTSLILCRHETYCPRFYKMSLGFYTKHYRIVTSKCWNIFIKETLWISMLLYFKYEIVSIKIKYSTNYQIKYHSIPQWRTHCWSLYIKSSKWKMSFVTQAVGWWIFISSLSYHSGRDSIKYKVKCPIIVP